MSFDMLIPCGEVVDPGGGGLRAGWTSRSKGERIAAVDRDHSQSKSALARDSRRERARRLAPGLVDLHAHVVPQADLLGIQSRPDRLVRSGGDVLERRRLRPER